MDEREQMNNPAREDAQQQSAAEKPEQERVSEQRAYRREQTAGGDSIAQAKRVIDLIEQRIAGGRRVPLAKGMIVVSGEEITPQAVDACAAYGIGTLAVVRAD